MFNLPVPLIAMPLAKVLLSLKYLMIETLAGKYIKPKPRPEN